MSYAPSINDVLQRALRKIGDFAITSSGPRARSMEEARYWLDMVVAHVAARARTWWLVPATGTFPLIAGQRDYVLPDVLGPDQAADGVQFVVQLWIDDASTGVAVGQVNLLRREEYELVKGSAANAVGPATMAYIDRSARPTLRLVEAPDAVISYTARIVYQAYAPDLVKNRDVKLLDRFRGAWSLYLVTALAAQIANGPVRKAPKDEVDDMRREAAQLLHDLESYDAHEQNDQPQVVQFHNGI